jgi:hypothetical protein
MFTYKLLLVHSHIHSPPVWYVSIQLLSSNAEGLGDPAQLGLQRFETKDLAKDI